MIFARCPHSARSAKRAPIRARPSRLVWSTIVLALVALALSGCWNAQEMPRMGEGLLDLSGWNFETGGVVALEGDWEICWNAFVSAESGDCPVVGWKSFPVPRLWSDGTVSSPIGGKGIASYRASLELPADSTAYTLRAGSPMAAYRLWINGQPMGGVGEPGPTAETSTSKLENRDYALPVGASRIEILVHVANFEFRGGGLRRTWFVGPTNQIVARNAYELLGYAAFAATTIGLGVFFLVQLAFRPSEFARGWLGVFLLLIGMRTFSAGTSDLYHLLMGWASFGFLLRLEYLSSAFLVIVATVYLRGRVPDVMPPRTTRLLLMILIALVPIDLFAPIPIMLASLVVLMVIAPIVLLLAIVEYGRAYRMGVEDTGPTMVASTIFMIGIVLDIVRSRTGWSAPVEIGAYFAIAWVGVESFGLLRNYAGVYSEVEALSEELQEANFELQETEEAVVRFVPFGLLELLGKASVREVETGDHADRELSVMHCGFPGAQGLRELGELPAGIDLSNRFVSRLERCAHGHGGFMNRYSGDGIQIIFPGGPDHAIAAGMAILAETRAFSAEYPQPDRGPIPIGLGVDTGSVMVAIMGGEARLIESLDGDPVEHAPRIAALAAQTNSHFMISAAARRRLGDSIPLGIRLEPGRAIEAAGSTIETFEVCDGESEGSN